MKRLVLILLFLMFANLAVAGDTSVYNVLSFSDDCSGSIGIHQCCYDTDNYTLCCGDGSNCNILMLQSVYDTDANDVVDTCEGISSGTTIDCNGVNIIDGTNTFQFAYFDAFGSLHAKNLEFIYPYTRENPTDADAFLIFKAPEALTITGIDCIVDPADSGESVVIDVRECDSSGDNCATVDTTITCTNAGASDDGSLSNPSIDSGNWVMIDTGTVTGTVTQLVVTIKYTR